MRRSFRARAGLAVLSGILTAGTLTAPAAAAAATTTIAGTFTGSSGRPPSSTSVISAPHTFTVAAGETMRVDDRLIATGTVAGRMTNVDGTPLIGAEVSLWRNGEQITAVTTDENGFYSIGEVLPGEYEVAFAWSGLHYVPGTVTVESDVTTTVNGTLPQETTLLVKAVDSVSGAPVGAFCVQVWSRDEPVCGDENGDVAIAGLPAGRVNFNVDPTGSEFYLTQRGLAADLTDGVVTTVTVPLVLGGQIGVGATDRATGRTVDQTCYLIRAIGRPETFGSGCTEADGAGKLREPVAPGTYEVFVVAPDGYGHQWLGRSGGTGDQRQAARVVVQPGGTATAPTVRLDPAGTITGVVTGADGVPQANVGVDFQANSIHDWHEVRTDQAGRYVLDKLGPYAWPLNFSRNPNYPDQWSGNVGNRFQAFRIPVVAGGTSTYDISLAKGSTLRGTITPGSEEVRLLAHNAVTGDPVGVFHGYDGGNAVTSYEMPLVGPQQVKILWDLYDGIDGVTWYADATDISAATKVGIPASGVKKLNLTHR